MTKNPFLNALAALIYITAVASVMFYGTKIAGNKPDVSIIGPIAAISLFTLSAASMGYIFLYQPALLFLEGKKKAGIDLFLKTTGVFAGLTIILLLLLFSNVLRQV